MSIKVELYIDAMSQPSRSLHWVCLLADIPFEIKPIHIAKNQHKSEAYLKIHPLGKVPALHDPDTKLSLFESGAIAQYLIRKYNISGQLYPSSEGLRVKVDAFMHWYPLNLRGPLTKYVFSAFLAPSRKITVSPQTVENARKDAGLALDAIEKFWLKDNQWIVSEGSLADIFCYGEISELFVIAGFDVFENRPQLLDWAKRMRNLKGYDEVHKVLNVVKKKYNPESKL